MPPSDVLIQQSTVFRTSADPTEDPCNAFGSPLCVCVTEHVLQTVDSKFLHHLIVLRRRTRSPESARRTGSSTGLKKTGKSGPVVIVHREGQSAISVSHMQMAAVLHQALTRHPHARGISDRSSISPKSVRQIHPACLIFQGKISRVENFMNL